MVCPPPPKKKLGEGGTHNAVDRFFFFSIPPVLPKLPDAVVGVEEHAGEEDEDEADLGHVGHVSTAVRQFQKVKRST